jgi:hypothetical protein
MPGTTNTTSAVALCESAKLRSISGAPALGTPEANSSRAATANSSAVIGTNDQMRSVKVRGTSQ